MKMKHHRNMLGMYYPNPMGGAQPGWDSQMQQQPQSSFPNQYSQPQQQPPRTRPNFNYYPQNMMQMPYMQPHVGGYQSGSYMPMQNQYPQQQYPQYGGGQYYNRQSAHPYQRRGYNNQYNQRGGGRQNNYRQKNQNYRTGYHAQNHGQSNNQNQIPQENKNNQNELRQTGEPMATSTYTLDGLKSDIQNFMKCPQDMQRNILGELLFPQVQKHCGENAPKITGMLVDFNVMEIQEIIELIESEGQLVERIKEAQELLDSK